MHARFVSESQAGFQATQAELQAFVPDVLCHQVSLPCVQHVGASSFGCQISDSSDLAALPIIAMRVLVYFLGCRASSLEEALWKIDEIERSPVLREQVRLLQRHTAKLHRTRFCRTHKGSCLPRQILDHVKRHLHLVDFSSVPTVAGLLSRVRRFNPRCSSSCDIGALTLGHA